jgi:hypothetical protein
MNTTRVKNFLIIVLLGASAILVYRIFDLGVTHTYLSDELSRTQNEKRIVSRFQRTQCSSINVDSKDFSVFKKEKLIVIDGVAFECKMSLGNSESLLHHYVGND